MIRYFLFVLAVLIVLSMAGYAISLFWKIRRQQQQIEQAKRERYRNICDSVDVIARAMLSGQCDLSEGVLRLKPLLDVIGKKLAVFPAMWALYQVVESMPILDERKNLKRNERMKLDLERETKEAALEDEIKQECRQLLDDIQQFSQGL
ncbi:coproporphyrinogen III oxidase [Haemophilus paracuniculus]|uniref:Coproporphyrinogen III oxidase n=1 Tax=Haemophilus paracuniculus TaxID=734 RepID=A0A1T0AUT2_9PAST|nr:DUF2489 domain-containing protein [Haemophilus paracuniculus]OOS00627.1 coproporphyrinogen III oxidase [Haemophilus paracuniculus]